MKPLSANRKKKRVQSCCSHTVPPNKINYEVSRSPSLLELACLHTQTDVG